MEPDSFSPIPPAAEPPPQPQAPAPPKPPAADSFPAFSPSMYLLDAFRTPAAELPPGITPSDHMRGIQALTNLNIHGDIEQARQMLVSSAGADISGFGFGLLGKAVLALQVADAALHMVDQGLTALGRPEPPWIKEVLAVMDRVLQPQQVQQALSQVAGPAT